MSTCCKYCLLQLNIGFKSIDFVLFFNFICLNQAFYFFQALLCDIGISVVIVYCVLPRHLLNSVTTKLLAKLSFYGIGDPNFADLIFFSNCRIQCVQFDNINFDG